MSNHPNATVAGGSTGLSVLLIFLLSKLHVSLAPELVALLAGGIGTVALFIGRRGLKGLVGIVWKGSSDGAPPCPPKP